MRCDSLLVPRLQVTSSNSHLSSFPPHARTLPAASRCQSTAPRCTSNHAASRCQTMTTQAESSLVDNALHSSSILAGIPLHAYSEHSSTATQIGTLQCSSPLHSTTCQMHCAPLLESTSIQIAAIHHTSRLRSIPSHNTAIRFSTPHQYKPYLDSIAIHSTANQATTILAATPKHCTPQPPLSTARQTSQPLQSKPIRFLSPHHRLARQTSPSLQISSTHGVSRLHCKPLQSRSVLAAIAHHVEPLRINPRSPDQTTTQQFLTPHRCMALLAGTRHNSTIHFDPTLDCTPIPSNSHLAVTSVPSKPILAATALQHGTLLAVSSGHNNPRHGVTRRHHTPRPVQATPDLAATSPQGTPHRPKSRRQATSEHITSRLPSPACLRGCFRSRQ